MKPRPVMTCHDCGLLSVDSADHIRVSPVHFWKRSRKEQQFVTFHPKNRELSKQIRNRKPSYHRAAILHLIRGFPCHSFSLSLCAFVNDCACFPRSRVLIHLHCTYGLVCFCIYWQVCVLLHFKRVCVEYSPQLI